MSAPSSSRRPDRPDLDTADVERVYSELEIDSTDELETLIERYMEQRGWPSYESSTACRRDLVRSFEDAFIDESGQPIVPEAVDAALEDAAHWVDSESADGSASVDPGVVARLVDRVGQMVPAYADRGLSTAGAVSLAHDEF